jgi:hypothetical protein
MTSDGALELREGPAAHLSATAGASGGALVWRVGGPRWWQRRRPNGGGGYYAFVDGDLRLQIRRGAKVVWRRALYMIRPLAERSAAHHYLPNRPGAAS